MSIDALAPEISLPLDRPMFSPPLKPDIEDTPPGTGDNGVSADALFELVHVDKARLNAHIWRALQSRDQIALTELVSEHPLELGLAELVTYLSIASENPDNVIDDANPTMISWMDGEGLTRRATMPTVVFIRVHRELPEGANLEDVRS